MDKKGLQFGFTWIFAIIVGMVVIILAVYAVVNLMSADRIEGDTKVAAELGILLHPVETNLETGKYSTIVFPAEKRLYNNCRETGTFGRQGLSTAVKSGIGEAWDKPGIETSFYNKYVFSEKIEQGKKMHVFAKPFEMPYKIGDLIFISALNYCFVNPINEVEEEITDLNMEHIRIVSSLDDCWSDEESVCFGSGSCDVKVDHILEKVEKDGETLHYEGSLIYGAIFADHEIYECQVQRLMKRAGELAQIYASKTTFLSGTGCASGLEGDLATFATASRISSSAQLGFVNDLADEIRRRNELLSCRLF